MPEWTRREFLAAGLGAAGASAVGRGAWAGPAEAAAGLRPGEAGLRPGAAGSPLDRVVIEPDTLVGQDGFYRVGRSTTGRWWLLRPDGRPILYRGVCALFMPDVGGSEAAAYRRHWEKQHGRDTDAFVAHCLGFIEGLGFNALGEWATPQFWDRGRPYTVLIHARKDAGNRFTVQPPKHVDVFDPGWRAAYEARCKEVCTPLRDKKDLVGYFVDNEAAWGQARRDHVWGEKGDMADRNVLGKEPLLLQYFLALDPKRGGHRAAWEFVLARHGGSAAQVAKDWGADFDSPAALADLHRKGMVLDSKAFGADQDAFTAHFTREYFRLTAEAIRRHDPNHLLLGCRHGAPPGDVVLKAYDRRHVDVLSFNNYRPNFRQRADEYSAHVRLPMLNGEFSWASGGFLDWNRYVAGKTFGDQEKEVCRRKGIAALEGAFTHPALIGYTWYKFCYRFPDADGPTYGLLDPAGRINRFNAAMLKAIHARLEGIACGEIEPAKA